jgi:hypothetical protein
LLGAALHDAGNEDDDDGAEVDDDVVDVDEGGDDAAVDFDFFVDVVGGGGALAVAVVDDVVGDDAPFALCGNADVDELVVDVAGVDDDADAAFIAAVIAAATDDANIFPLLPSLHNSFIFILI